MASPRARLLGRVDAAWDEFNARVQAVPPDRWSAPTSAGWSLRAMLAHVAAWHDATAFRLHRFAATGRPQPKVEENDDAFNARVAEETADRSPDDVRLSLGASFDRLRAAIASLPPDLDPDGWTEAVVAGNSFGHYDEHLPELDGAAS